MKQLQPLLAKDIHAGDMLVVSTNSAFSTMAPVKALRVFEVLPPGEGTCVFLMEDDQTIRANAVDILLVLC